MGKNIKNLLIITATLATAEVSAVAVAKADQYVLGVDEGGGQNLTESYNTF